MRVAVISACLVGFGCVCELGAFLPPIGKRMPALNVLLAELAVLAEGTAPCRDEPIQARSVRADAAASEPFLERRGRLRQRDVARAAPARTRGVLSQDPVTIDVEVFAPVSFDLPRVHVLEEVIEQDVPPCRGAGVEAREQLASDLAPGPADLA